jgi:hypothetical protein
VKPCLAVAPSRWLAATTLILALGAGCVAVRRATTPSPQLFVSEEKLIDAAGTACGAAVDVASGPLPAGAVALSRYHVTTAQPVPLAQVLALLAVHGGRRCAHGVRVLRAEVADGADGVVAVEAVAYALPAPGTDGAANR